jgi:hypothetical protein
MFSPLSRDSFGVGEALLGASALTGLASDAIAGFDDTHDHPPIFVVFKLVQHKNTTSTYFIASSTTKTLLLIDRLDEPRRPRIAGSVEGNHRCMGLSHVLLLLFG